MPDDIEIAALTLDGTSENHPKIWRIVGRVREAALTYEKDQKCLTTRIRAQIFYGPPRDWEIGDKQPKAHWSPVAEVSISSKHPSYKECDATDGYVLWSANLFPDKDQILAHFLDFLRKEEYETDLEHQPKIFVSAWFETPDKENQRKVTRAFASKDLNWRKPFDVGVLLVHGISKYQPNQVLSDFGEPLIKFIEDWAASYNRWSASQYTQAARNAWAKRIGAGALRNRMDQLGAREAVDAFVAHDREGAEEEVNTGEAPVVIAVRMHDLQISGEYEGTATLSVSSLHQHGAHHEAFIAMKEARWSDHTIVPKRHVMLRWIWSAYPITIANYLHRRLADEDWEPRALCKASKFFFLLASPIYLFFVLLLVCILQILALIAFLPIGIVQDVVGRIFATLSGTVGHSFAFIESTVRRRAITSKVSTDLDWLDDNCDRLSILSHSQGVAVIGEVLKSRQWFNVRQWNMMGSGLRALRVLKHESNAIYNKVAIWFVAASLAIVALLVFVLFWQGVGQAPLNILNFSIAFGSIYLSLLVFVMIIAGAGTEIGGSLRGSSLNGAREYNSTHDPVSMGRQFNDADKQYIMQKNQEVFDFYGDKRPLERIESHQVFNRGSTILDHSRYMENTEEVTSCLVFDILSLARDNTGLPDLGNLHEKDPARLDGARAYRRALVAHDIFNRFCFRVTLALILLVLFAPLWSSIWQSSDCAVDAAFDCADHVLGLLPQLDRGQSFASLFVLAMIWVNQRASTRALRATGAWLIGPKSQTAPWHPFTPLRNMIFATFLIAATYFWVNPDRMEHLVMGILVPTAITGLEAIFFN
ncbi:MAG: hypothetical protein AAF686_06670 [Pseudomonadota bacterium]